MRKLLFLLILVVSVFLVNAQTTPEPVAPDGYISGPYYKQLWGTTADTMTNADTLSFVYRITGEQTQDFTIKLYSDHVSGTAGGTLVSYHSIDGNSFESTGDTITVASLTGDGMDSEVISLNDFNYPYLKLYFLQTGTAVTVPRTYVYSKKN
jgi:hypothetical protein